MLSTHFLLTTGILALRNLSYNVQINSLFKIFQITLMAFRILRLRKEARRNAKLDEIFQERDKEGTGLISYEQLEEIYRIYQVREGGGKYA